MSARLCFTCVALSALALSVPARADSEPGRLRLGLRSGFAVPYGRFADVRTLATFRDTNAHALSDDIHGAIPIWLDAGYQLTPRLMPVPSALAPASLAANLAAKLSADFFVFILQ